MESPVPNRRHDIAAALAALQPWLSSPDVCRVMENTPGTLWKPLDTPASGVAR